MNEITTAFFAGTIVPAILFVFFRKHVFETCNKNFKHTSIDTSNTNRISSKNSSENKQNGCEGDKASNAQENLSEDDLSEDDEFESRSPTNKLCSNWGMAHVPYKMVLCVNTDLNMGKGKMAAQCCHAAVGCYKRAMRHCPAAVRAWEYSGCAKIALKCPNIDEMQLIKAKASSLDIPLYLVEDAGRTQIAAGSRTVLGLFGPTSVFEGVTDHLKLM